MTKAGLTRNVDICQSLWSVLSRLTREIQTVQRSSALGDSYTIHWKEHESH